MITLITFSDNFHHFDTAISEYKKRLGKNFELVQLKPSKKRTPKEIIQDETIQLQKKLEKMKGYKVVMSVAGKQLSTEDLSHTIEKYTQTHSHIIFIIGGSYGMNEDDLNNYIDSKISLSKMTFPHALAVLNLTEQIYRCNQIQKNT
ncbi:MAG: 23S rRNA (pseudouridine(1915)-N(3))-methyltransferase RlmH [Patescibacteria group bacterium]|nr:23S rRNA (pseudouridine(1915)-N(3))-methyltransferase RlmH [Patescibacteria group bacterium]